MGSDFGYTTRVHNQPNKSNNQTHKIKSTVYYVMALGVLTVGFSYAAVPLYRLFCQAYGYGGTTVAGHDTSKLESMKPNRNRIIRVKFNADTATSLTWNFRPQQTEIKLPLGETALAFYTAMNPTDRPIDGISTYNVVPYEAGQYFNKIQCFCFEEQRLNPHEQASSVKRKRSMLCISRVNHSRLITTFFLFIILSLLFQVDMPVLFYIDPALADDPLLENLETIILSYTFFEAKDSDDLPIPDYATPHAS
nr:EOG090X0GO2 [Lepidurus arcticus]